MHVEQLSGGERRRLEFALAVLGRPRPRAVKAEHTHHARAGWLQTLQHLDRGGLAGTVGSQQGEQFTPVHAESHVPYCLEPTVIASQPSDLDHRIPNVGSMHPLFAVGRRDRFTSEMRR